MPLYKQDSNDTSKQTPDIKPGGTSRFSFAECPTKEQVNKRPTYVNINKVGTYCFLYETTASTGGTTTTLGETYVTGSVVQNAAAGGIRLDASPIAWRRSDAAGVVGDVTFVYVRVR